MIRKLAARAIATFLICLIVTSTIVWAQEDIYGAITGPDTENKGHNIYLGREGEPKNQVAYSLNADQAFPKKETGINELKWKSFLGDSENFQKAISWKPVKDQKGQPLILPEGVDLDSPLEKEGQKESKLTYRQKFGLSKHAEIKTGDSGERIVYDYSSRLYDRDLRDALLKVVYNGASDSKKISKLQLTYGLTFDQMRKVTQDAIWFFTDSLYNYEMKQEVGADGEVAKIPLGPSLKKNLGDYTDSEYKAFLVLTGQVNTFSLEGYPKLEEPKKGQTLNIYINVSNGNEKEGYQNLLGTKALDEKTGQVIERNEISVIFSKIDVGGKELPGAKLEIKDSSNKTIESWTSGSEKQIFDLLPGSYFLHESEAPKGYKKTKDIAFTVSEEGEIRAENRSVKEVVMLNEKEEENVFDKTKVVFKKVDISGRRLSGAKLEVKDSKDNLIENWVSTNLDKTLEMNPGNYVLKEVTSPQGYKKAKDLSFEVTKEGKIILGGKIVSEVRMVNESDEKIEVLLNKVDSSGKALSGAEIEVKDSTGKRIYLWTTKGKKLLMKLDPGTYTMRENKAPLGYKLSKDIEFVLTKDGKIMVGNKQVKEVEMVNEKISRSLGASTRNGTTTSRTSNSNKNPQTFVGGYGPHIGAMGLAGATLVYAELKRRKNK